MRSMNRRERVVTSIALVAAAVVVIMVVTAAAEGVNGITGWAALCHLTWMISAPLAIAWGMAMIAVRTR